MGTLKIYRAFRDVPTFARVFPSDLLSALPLPGLVRFTLIINTDVHTEPGSHWVAVHLDTRSSSGYYFVSTASSRLYLTCDTSFDGLALSGTTTLAPCRVSPPKCADGKRVSRSVHGPGTGLSPLCRAISYKGAGPADGKDFPEGVWTTFAPQRRYLRRAVLHLQER